MKRNYLPCVMVLAVLSATSAWSQALDLSAIAEAALANDPERLIAIEQLRAAEADAAATKTKRLIDGSASVQATRSDPGESSPVGPTNTVSGDLSATSSLPLGSTLSLGGSYGYSTNKKADSDTATVKAGIRVPMFVNGKFVDPRIDGAAKTSGIELPVEAARDASDSRARATVDAAFRLALDAASVSRSVSLAERRSAIADRDLAIAEVKRDQGTIGYSDLAEKQRAADEARLSALEARLSRDAKIRALCAATGMDFAGIDPASLESLAAPASPAADTLLSNPTASAEARKAERDRRSAESSRILAGAEIAPTFGLQSSVTVPGPAARSEAKDAGLDEPDTSWSASALVSIPLPTGYGGNRLKAADARVSAARIAEADVAQSASNRTTALRDAWTACDAKVTLRAQLLAQATSRLELVRASLERQTATALDADRAELAVAEARSALEDSKNDLFKAALDIATQCGIDPRTIVKETQR